MTTTSKWARLANATLTFRRATGWTTDPETGNDVPSSYSTYTTRAYFKSAWIGDNTGQGVTVGQYPVEGYIVGVLPAWCNKPTDEEIECTIDHLGAGKFQHQGKIAVVRDEVERIGQGTPIQGFFVIQGSGK